MKMNVDALFEVALARTLDDGGGGMIIIFTEGEMAGEAKCCLVPFRPEGPKQKAELLRRCRRLAVLHRAFASMLVAEAWMATSPYGDRNSLPNKLEDAPGRREVLLVNCETRDNKELRVFQMKRDETGKLVDLPLYETHLDVFENNLNILPARWSNQTTH